MIASDYPDYRAYCEARRKAGLQVIPRGLWCSIKGIEEQDMTRKTWEKGTTIEDVVDMPGALRVIAIFTCHRVRDEAEYRVVVYECGAYAGDVHFLDDAPRVRNCHRQTGTQALEFVRDRYWPLVMSHKKVAGIGEVH